MDLSGLGKGLPVETIGEKKKRLDCSYHSAIWLIIRNDEDQIALMYVKEGRYYKLPGGCMFRNQDQHASVGGDTAEAQVETEYPIQIRSGVAMAHVYLPYTARYNCVDLCMTP